MTPRDLLRFQAENVENGTACPHGDTCNMCRTRRVMARLARKVLEREDLSDNEIMEEWCEMVTQEMRQMPSAN